LKKETQRTKIIAVAANLMGKKGYKATSLDEITRRVGIHKTTFFHYFNNKEELLLEVLKCGIAEVTRNLAQLVEAENIAPKEKLRQAIANHLNVSARYIDNVNVYHSEIPFLSEKNRRDYLRTRRSYADLFEKIIVQIKNSDREYFSGMDTRTVTYGILGMCNWVSKWFRKSGRLTTADIAQTFYSMIIVRGNSK